MHALRVHVLLACTGLALGLSYNFEIDSECPAPSFFWNNRRPLRPDLPFKSSVLPDNALGWHAEAGADSIDVVQSQDILYNEAYEWTKHVPIHHWKYAELAANATEFAELAATRGVRRALNTDAYEQLKCVAVSYTGAVQIPNALDTYLDIGHFEAHVHKTVCASPHTIYSNVTLGNIPVVGSVHLVCVQYLRANTDDTVVTKCKSEYDLPWLLLWFDAESMIYKSYRAEVRASLHQICAKQSGVI